MKLHVHVWAEAFESFKAEGVESGEDVEIAPEKLTDLTDLTDRFDVMISSRGGEKVLHVSPFGRGFGQR